MVWVNLFDLKVGNKFYLTYPDHTRPYEILAINEDGSIEVIRGAGQPETIYEEIIDRTNKVWVIC
jgi:hypothetical protein